MNKEAMKQPECKTCGDTKLTYGDPYGEPCPDCQQPPASDFTKEIREAYDPEGVPITYENVCTDINDLCNRLDLSLIHI